MFILAHQELVKESIRLFPVAVPGPFRGPSFRRHRALVLRSAVLLSYAIWM